jgi:hypothetical protein
MVAVLSRRQRRNDSCITFCLFKIKMNYMPVIPARPGLRQKDQKWEFKASLDYIASLRSTRVP